MGQQENIGKVSDEEKEEKIFSLGPALKFAFILLGVRLITKICLVFLGQAGFLISSVIASFSGIDAIVVNLSEMAGGIINFKMALLTLLVVNATNLLSKAGYSFIQGKKEFAYKFLMAILVVIGVSFIGYLFVQ